MEAFKKLELIRRIYCMNVEDVLIALDSTHLCRKFEYYHQEYGHHGVYNFMMSLDKENAEMMIEYLESNYL